MIIIIKINEPTVTSDQLFFSTRNSVRRSTYATTGSASRSKPGRHVSKWLTECGVGTRNAGTVRSEIRNEILYIQLQLTCIVNFSITLRYDNRNPLLFQSRSKVVSPTKFQLTLVVTYKLNAFHKRYYRRN